MKLMKLLINVCVQAEEDSDVWKNYIEYLDELVLDGLFNCIQCSLQYLSDNTDKENSEMPPLLECKLELQAPDMVFDPTLDQVNEKCIIRIPPETFG